MKVEPIYSQYRNKIEGPLLISPKIYYDKRGYFLESWNQLSFKKFTYNSVEFVQDNHSQSKRGLSAECITN